MLQISLSHVKKKKIQQISLGLHWILKQIDLILLIYLSNAKDENYSYFKKCN